jgi:hypothetical protein
LSVLDAIAVRPQTISQKHAPDHREEELAQFARDWESERETEDEEEDIVEDDDDEYVASVPQTPAPFEEDEEEEEILPLQIISKGFFRLRAFSDIPVTEGVGVTDVPPPVLPHTLDASGPQLYSSSPPSPEPQQEISYSQYTP